jgi:hypothetical protein
MEGQNENFCPVPKGILFIIAAREEKNTRKDGKKVPETYVPGEIL